MRFFVLVLLLLAACSSPSENKNTFELQTPSPTPVAQIKVEPSPTTPIVYPKLDLNSKQKKYLNESFPPDIRTFFENSDRLELLAEIFQDVSEDGDSHIFTPNRVVEISDAKQKREVMEAFYFDAAHEDSPAICFLPHHLLRATKDGKVLEIEICFDCARFEGVGANKSVSGTIVRQGIRRSEELFNRILKNQGKEYKP